jgi:hypothetical protein
VCCFSIASAPAGIIGRLFAPKVHVSKTNIFARMIAPGVQALAYGMNLSTAREIAMILPLPVVPGSGDDAVEFLSLVNDPRMFDDLGALFAPPMQPLARKGGIARLSQSMPTLVVHEIGAFVASYVPRREDFTRLDERFRMPKVLFDAVPHYADYGFAVFQLAPGKVTVHPMALTFPTRTPDKLFFPTVHVHDGRFHTTAKFDHALYYQRTGDADGTDEVGWMKPRKSYAELVVVDQAMARRTLHAKRPNEDVWIAAT